MQHGVKPLIYNEKFEAIVSRLDKVKRSGANVRAVCPVHGSKGQTLSVTEKDGGYIVAHCFSCGSGGPELVKSLGLPLALLFPEGDYKPPEITKQMREANILDAFILQQSPKAETLEEARAVTKAKERAKGFELKLEETGEEPPKIDHPALEDFRPNFETALNTSPALRSGLVDSHWEGVANRVKKRERRIADTAAAFSELEPAPKPTAEAWLLGLK